MLYLPVSVTHFLSQLWCIGTSAYTQQRQKHISQPISKISRLYTWDHWDPSKLFNIEWLLNKDDAMWRPFYWHALYAFPASAIETKIHSKNILLICHLTSTFEMPISIVAVSCSNNGLMSLFTSKHALQILSNFKFRIFVTIFTVTPAILNCTIGLCSSLLYNIPYYIILPNIQSYWPKNE